MSFFEKILSEKEATRKRVYEFYLANISKGKKFTVVHFKVENVHQSTIYRNIRRAGSGYERAVGSGRPSEKWIETRLGGFRVCLTTKIAFHRGKQQENSTVASHTSVKH
mgnify:CR=1 FL=1